MKYSISIDIDLPLEEVTELFSNPENMQIWQPELIELKPVSGEPGRKGAISKMTYKIGSRKMEMTETITERDLPREFSATYEAKGVWNLQRNIFTKIDKNTSKWTTISQFKCSGLMKVICWIMPGSFKRQTLKTMNQFKSFAENHPLVNNNNPQSA